jgi:catechol 2,3-dioxygenase-like lactoylglutathione lyase family enzyme
MSIFTHTTVGTNDRAKSKAFYEPTLGALGVDYIGELGEAGSIYGANGAPAFIVFTPIDGQAAACGNGPTIGFAAPTREAVRQFHAAGVANGGSDEGAPGPRPFTDTAYAAYLRDPDGNKITAFCFKDGE